MEEQKRRKGAREDEEQEQQEEEEEEEGYEEDEEEKVLEDVDVEMEHARKIAEDRIQTQQHKQWLRTLRDKRIIVRYVHPQPIYLLFNPWHQSTSSLHKFCLYCCCCCCCLFACLLTYFNFTQR